MTTRTTPPQDLLEAMERAGAGFPSDALDIIERALKTAEDPSPYLALGSITALRSNAPQRAIPMLRQLLVLHPQDQPSTNNLATALVQAGDLDGAMQIAAGSGVPALARVEGYIHQQRGDEAKAAAAYRRAIEGDPADLASLNNLGNILTSLGDVDGAIAVYERAIALSPMDVNIYLNLGELLRIADRGPPRLKVLLDAERVAPEDVRVLIDLGMAYAHVEDIDRALATYRRAMALSPRFGEAHIEYGLALEALNRTDELAELVGTIDPDDAAPEAAFLLAWDARRKGDFEKAAALAEKIPDTVLPMRRWHLVGGIEDRLGNPAEAFEAFERMNDAAALANPPRKGRTFREIVEADLARWTPDWAASWTGDHSPQDDRRDPIFLIGFPRSGTTLLDTMLMGMPDLSILEERPMISRLLTETAGEDIATYDAGRIKALRNRYFEIAETEGWDKSRWLVDKHPLNMRNIFLIHRLFPQAKIILAERHPYDVVLSCFMANFAMNPAMRSFVDLEEAALTYDAVWRAWQRAIENKPVDWHAVRYERLVQDPREELSPLVSWLGLNWDENLLDHTQTARGRGLVRTASYSQIGEQLYSRAVGRWRAYSSQLAPVMPTLEPWAKLMDYEVA